MYKKFWNKIKKTIEDKFTSSVALIIGTFMGSALTFLVAAMVFTFTYSGRIEQVEATIKPIPELIQNVNRTSEDISTIKSDLRDFKKEFHDYLILKSK